MERTKAIHDGDHTDESKKKGKSATTKTTDDQPEPYIPQQLSRKKNNKTGRKTNLRWDKPYTRPEEHRRLQREPNIPTGKKTREQIHTDTATVAAKKKNEWANEKSRRKQLSLAKIQVQT